MHGFWDQQLLDDYLASTLKWVPFWFANSESPKDAKKDFKLNSEDFIYKSCNHNIVIQMVTFNFAYCYSYYNYVVQNNKLARCPRKVIFTQKTLLIYKTKQFHETFPLNLKKYRDNWIFTKNIDPTPPWKKKVWKKSWRLI